MCAEVLFAWFREQGGTVDSERMDIVAFPGAGNGAIALQDIPEGHTLFTLPRSLTLSSRTSLLPSKIGDNSWKKNQLHKGWAGLILCMMWEEAQGTASRWSTYLDLLPKTFDTPMFWGEEDLKELEGTNVIDKIGRADAEQDYRDKVLTVLQERPDLFPRDHIANFYSVENYHIMGSRILSRSFHVEKFEGEDEAIGGDTADAPNGDAMDVDDEPHGADEEEQGKEAQEEADEDDEEDDVEDPADVAMVPLADVLNARSGCENARLFYEERDLRMVTTKAISKGEQIWNTYGNPPNSDLLRRYGHVDLVPLPSGKLGNPADVVEVQADLLVQMIASQSESGHNTRESNSHMEERIDWWLDEGGDDSFVFDANMDETPETFISLIRLLLQSDDEWKKTREKSKPPKPKVDAEVLRVAIAALERRLDQYPTTIETDEDLLSAEKRESLSTNKLHAIVVRFGEKKILQRHLGKFHNLQKALTEAENDESSKGSKKRTLSRKEERATKKARR